MRRFELGVETADVVEEFDRQVVAGLFDRAGWLAGARVGVGAETPVGPVAFEYGFASSGQRAAFIRVGRWF